MSAVEDGLRRAGGGEDDVFAGSLIVETVEGDDLCDAGEAGALYFNWPIGELHGYLVGDLPCDLCGPLLRTVGDEDAGCSLLDEVTRGQLGHLTRAYDQFLAAQATEEGAGEVDGDRRDGDGGAADWVSVRTRLATEKARCRSGSSAVETAPT